MRLLTLALIMCLFAVAPAQANPPLQFAPCAPRAPVYYQQPAFSIYSAPVFRAPVYRAPVFRAPVYRAPSQPFFAPVVGADVNVQIDNSRRGLFGRRR